MPPEPSTLPDHPLSSYDVSWPFQKGIQGFLGVASDFHREGFTDIVPCIVAIPFLATCPIPIRRLMLYPTELRAHLNGAQDTTISIVRTTTRCMKAYRSTSTTLLNPSSIIF